MRKAWLVFLLLAVPATLTAQQTPAPKPGHPLDPADVYTLSSSGSRPATPYSYGGYAAPYVSYPVDMSLFGNSTFAPVSTATSPPIRPLLFGQFNGRPVALFSASGEGLPPLFFVRGRSGFFTTPRGLVFGFVGR